MGRGAETREMSVDEAGVERAARDLGARISARRNARLVFGPITTASSSSLLSIRQRLGPRGRMDDELCDHRIIERRDAVAGGDARVDAHPLEALLPAEAHREDAPWRGQEIVLGVFRVDARLDRRAARRRSRSAASGSALAGGDAELPFDEIEPGHRLGDGMLDLQPRVHLEEIKVAGP